MLKGKTIVLGVTGGIAVYKSADLVSRLKKLNANVEVIMTEAAAEFVTPLTFQTMSGNKVHMKMFEEVKDFDVEHISLAKKADVILVAPATANTIGKVANGICDNLLTTVIMAGRSRVVFAPAMNTEMYRNPFYQENMEKLKKLGYEFITPASGLLACGDVGEGKMAEPADIVEYLVNSFVEKDLLGKTITITAGPTIAPLDPVRYMTNHSSGKMGYNLAEEAVYRGASVNLISGPTSLEVPKGVNFIPVKTTEDMLEGVRQVFETTDILIKSAAPLDYSPTEVSSSKIKKKDDGNLHVEYKRTPDIAEYFGKIKRDNQMIIGFAAETDNVYDYALKKLKKKNFDFIVANDLTKQGAGFGVDTNIITIICKDGNMEEYPLMNKRQVAKTILNKAVYFLDNKS